MDPQQLAPAVQAARANADQLAKVSQDMMQNEILADQGVAVLRRAIADAAQLAGEHHALAQHHQRQNQIHLDLYDELMRLQRAQESE